MAGRKSIQDAVSPYEALRKAEREERARLHSQRLAEQMKAKQEETTLFMQKHGLKTPADCTRLVRQRLQSMMGTHKTRAQIIHRWVLALQNPTGGMRAREVARQALDNLRATESELRAAGLREPGEDPEERSAA